METLPSHLATHTIAMHKLRMWHKLSFASSTGHQGILSAIVLYVNPTSLMENARRTQKERFVAERSILSS
jgi:hypothetical protein